MELVPKRGEKTPTGTTLTPTHTTILSPTHTTILSPAHTIHPLPLNHYNSWPRGNGRVRTRSFGRNLLVSAVQLGHPAVGITAR